MIQKTKYIKAKEYVNKFFNFRFNEIELCTEIKRRRTTKRSPWVKYHRGVLLDELYQKDINISQLELSLIVSSWKKYSPPINVFKDYFLSLSKVEDSNYIDSVFSFLKTSKEDQQEDFLRHAKMWAIRCVSQVFNTGNYANKNALVLVSQGQQNIGKTSFLNFLCPPALKQYCQTGFVGDSRKWQRQLATNFLINLDEFSGVNIKSGNIKSLITQKYIKYNSPFIEKEKSLPRYASFYASVNKGTGFIKDITGSSRWVCFEIEKINHDYNNEVTGKKLVDINKFWASAYYGYIAGEKSYLTAEDIIKVEKNNIEFIYRTQAEIKKLKALKSGLKKTIPKQFYNYYKEVAEKDIKTINKKQIALKTLAVGGVVAGAYHGAKLIPVGTLEWMKEILTIYGFI